MLHDQVDRFVRDKPSHVHISLQLQVDSELASRTGTPTAEFARAAGGHQRNVLRHARWTF